MKRYPSAILATCVLPWRSDYTLDELLFRKQIRLLRDHLTNRLYIFGTAGEGYAVSDDLFEQIAYIFRSEMEGPENNPMVGLISLSLRTIQKRIEYCISLGIKDFQLSFPCWGSLTDHEVDVFFLETCGRFPECRFLHYNLPRSRRILTGLDYSRIAAAYPNLVAVKYGGSDEEACLDMLRSAPELQLFVGESAFSSFRDQYECGLLISLAAINFQMAIKLFQARGNELSRMRKDIDVILEAILRAVRDQGHMDGVYDKLLIRSHLPEFPLRLLPPYTSVSERSVKVFQDSLPQNWRVLQMPDL